MEMNTNYVELVLGVESSRDRYTPQYMEGVNYLKEATGTIESLKKFLNSIERIANTSQVKDERISKSRGDLKSMEAHKSIDEAISFIKDNKLTAIVPFKELTIIHDKLIENTNLYKAGYDQEIPIMKLEYENAVYLLITGLAMILSAEVEFKGYGSQFKVVRKKSKTGGVLYDTIKKMAKELNQKSHSGYLKMLVEAAIKEKVKPSPVKESAIYEANLPAASDVAIILDNIKAIGKGGMKIFNRIKASIFGIVPLIRSCIYLRYKKKADSIQALETQTAYIRQNIEILKNKKTMDPKTKAEIIKKQEAIANAYMKKAEKLRAELCEGEADAAQAAKEDKGDVQISAPKTSSSSSSSDKKDDANPDDNNSDFVLEAVDEFNYEIIPANMPLPPRNPDDIGEMEI